MKKPGIMGPTAAAIFAAAVQIVAFAPVPAQAAAITIDDKGACSSWSWDSAARTLSCGAGSGGGTPVACAAISGPTAGTVGSPITLTANCPGAASYLWSGGNCAGVTTQSCGAVASSAGNVFYTVSASTGSGGPYGSLAGYTVSWSGTAAFTCSFSPAPGTATVGSALPLTIACSNGTPLSFSWGASAPAGCSGACTAAWGSTTQTSSGSNTLTLPSAGIWTVTVNVSSTSGTQSQVQASVQATASSGGGGSTISCAAQGFSKTLVYNWNWATTTQVTLDTYSMADTAGGIGLGANGILVIPFVPTTPADTDNLSFVDAIGYPAPNQTNVMTLAISTVPCDLSAPNPASSVSYAPTVTYGVGTVTPPWTGIPTATALTPGVQYYINVAGRSGATPTCVVGAIGNCEMRVALRKPPGH